MADAIKQLTQEEITARIADFGQHVGADVGRGPAHTNSPPVVHHNPHRNHYRHIELLDAISRRAVEALRAPDGITFGLAEIDLRTRGCRAQDLVIITGFSHSGKTQLVNTMIHNNPDRRILFMSMDDPAEMIVTKLAAMKYGVSAEALEEQIRSGSQDVEQIFADFAAAYPNLIITDKHLSIETMGQAVEEAIHEWGGLPPHAVVVDYLELIANDGDGETSGVKSMAKDLQLWAKRCAWPTIVLHQGTRSNAKPGTPITLLSMAFGGEQQATIVIGVRRKRDQADLEPEDRQYHSDTVTLHIVKNKRPGGKLTEYEGIDFRMDAETGLIRTWRAGDRHRPSAADMVQQSQAVVNMTQGRFDE